MRVLHVSPYYEDAWAYGGIPRVVGALARGLARRGHDVTVCTTDACDGASRLPAVPGDGTSRPGTPVLRAFPNLSNTLAYHLQLFLPAGLGAWLDRHAHEFDVAHLHGCHHVPGALAAGRLRRAGVPYVLAPNGTAPRIERRRIAKYLFDVTVGRGVVSGAARLLAVSDAERRQLIGLGVPPSAIRIVPNPVDLTEFARPIDAAAFRARRALGRRPLVLFLGKLTPRKRVDVLVRAFAALGRPDAALVIAGNDLGSEPAIRRLVRRLGLDTQTQFTGLLRGRARLEALAGADVVVYPSSDEVFGLVPLEALLAGTPVVGGDDSGCGEVIATTGGGLTVPPGDAHALEDAIARVLGDVAAWRAKARDAAARVRALYDAEVVCARLEHVYAELVTAEAGAMSTRTETDPAGRGLRVTDPAVAPRDAR